MPSGTPSVLVNGPDTCALFWRAFDQAAFPFSHSLHQSPCFTHAALLDLARRFESPPNRFYVEEDDTTPGDGWRIGTARKSLRENLEEIAHTHSFVMLKRVHEEPEYRQILETCSTELSDLTGIDIRSRYRDALMTIIVASPYRVTPYHIDSEANLLMQIQGSKSVYIFDGNDRQVLTTSELEQFWSGDIHAPAYKEKFQERASRFDLTPGSGVCNPVIFPHWVKNGNNVSISLSINFKRMTDDVADAYRVNSRLRKIGFHPEEPGRIQFIDHTKGLVYRTIRDVKHTVDGLRHWIH